MSRIHFGEFKPLAVAFQTRKGEEVFDQTAEPQILMSDQFQVIAGFRCVGMFVRE